MPCAKRKGVKKVDQLDEGIGDTLVSGAATRHHRPIDPRSASWSNAHWLARMLARRDDETDAVVLAVDADRCVHCGRNAVGCANGRRSQDTRRFQALVPC